MLTYFAAGDITPSDISSVWTLLTAIVLTVGSIITLILKGRRDRDNSPEPTRRNVVRAIEPVAAQTAIDAVNEYKQAVTVPLREELEREQWLRQEAEQRQARAEQLAQTKTAQNESLIGRCAVLTRENERLNGLVIDLSGQLEELRRDPNR